MLDQPELVVGDLLLRPFNDADAAAVQRLAGDERIADTTASIPHPYPDSAAADWISDHPLQWQERSNVHYAITLNGSSELVGAISLMNFEGNVAELGYWVGVPYWGRGFASTAARCLVELGMQSLGLQRIHARALTRNPASCKVLQRVGFSHLGSEPSVCGYRRESELTEYYELLV